MKVVKTKGASPPSSSIVVNNSPTETSYSGMSKGFSKIGISCTETSAPLADEKHNLDTSSTGRMQVSISKESNQV